MEKPVFALLYDFDKTLCVKDMQEYGFIPDVNMTASEFWREADALSREKKMDSVLAYLYIMLERAHQARKPIRREDFVSLGKGLAYYPGVEDFFARVNRFGASQGMKIEHYIISSGLREIIEGSALYGHFREVFACEFLYDENGVACWPKNVVNYTTKTQFLYRVNKGVLDISDDRDLNKYTPEDERRVPFRNMLYIGDGFTDVPCMKLVKVNGGCSIAVYPEGGKDKISELLQDGRVDFLLKADYGKDGELYKTVCDIIRRASAADALIRKNAAQLAGIRKR